MVGRIFLGRYEAIRLLGEGGMGRVYLARQLDLGRQVVVKVMHEHLMNDALFLERFQRETKAMAKFQHHYAVTLYDASLDPMGLCIVMEYIRGITLDVLLQRNGKLNPARVGRLLGQLCEVLQAAHSAGIVHRDLKPTNLMVVDPDTPYEVIKVMDFGLAKLTDPAANKGRAVTGPEFAVGTPGYMCPEQARGKDMDHRGDLYSVGVLLYELLTGRLPFAGQSTMDVLLAHATEEPPSFAAVGVTDSIPPAVEDVVKDCLSKAPVDRPSTARELAERYEVALGQSFRVPMSPPRPSPSHNGTSNRPPAGRAEPPVTPVSDPPLSVPVLPPFDPNSVVHHLEAWMPEKIAAYKLKGFVQDVGGEVVESVPGRIKVRLGGRGSVYAPGGGLSWFGLSRRGVIEMDLYLQRPDPNRDSHLRITVVLRPLIGSTVDIEIRSRCTQIYCDLRGYLMGQNG